MSPLERLVQAQEDLFWLPSDARAVEEPDLLLIACPRPTPVLNSVLRLRAEGARLERLLDRIEAEHRGGPSRIQVGPLEPACVRARLEARGWRRTERHIAFSQRSDRLAALPEGGFQVGTVETMAHLEEWLAVNEAAFGVGRAPSPEESAEYLRACTGPGARVRRVLAREPDGRAVAAGGLTLCPASSMGFLWAGGTAPEARRRGAYRATLRARGALAEDAGVDRLGVYARVESSAPVFAALGFQALGEMDFWDRWIDP